MQPIDAYFVGGELDGKTYSIPYCQEWTIAVMPKLDLKTYLLEEDVPSMVETERQIYKSIGVGNVFWLHRIIK